MGLSKVWVRTSTDGLVRADHIIGLSSHQTPSLPGKPVHWLVDVTLGVSVGSGGTTGWDVNALHRTLIQTRTEPVGATEALAELLARLSDADPAGIIITRMVEAAPNQRVEFTFQPFTAATATTSSEDHTEP